MKVLFFIALIFPLLCFGQPAEINLTAKNSISFDREINKATVDVFTAALNWKRQILPKSQPLYVIIASPGGTYESALVLQKVFSDTPNLRVFCRYCASAAGYIYATYAGPRFYNRGSHFIAHEMFLEKVTVSILLNPRYIKDLIESSFLFNKDLSAAIKMPQDEYENKIINKEWHVKGYDLGEFHIGNRKAIFTCDTETAFFYPKTCNSDYAGEVEMKDLMLDLETFNGGSAGGTAEAICQIGACYFDRNTGEVGEVFKINVDASTSGKLHAATVYWWLSQSKEAQNSILADPKVPESEALLAFNEFAKNAARIWSHATFDFSALEMAYKRQNIKPSFKYSSARDIRTLVDLPGTTIDKTPRTGLHHDALEDCKHQVKYCHKAFEAIAKRRQFKWT